MPPRIFLDANVLFSAALGGPVFEAIWAVADRGGFELVTSVYCLVEARENLARKRPEAMVRLSEKLALVKLVAEAEGEPWIARLLPEKDRPVLAAAVASGAEVVLTGDVRHFGKLMEREDLRPRVLTPAMFVQHYRPKT